MENNRNDEDIKLNEDMLSDEIIDEHEENYYNKIADNGGKKPNNKNKKKKIIAGVIVALVAIGLISGFLLYMNNTKKDERADLVAEIHKNTLTKDNAQYLQNQKYVNQDQLNELNLIDEKANDDKETLDHIKDLRKNQAAILDPINKKLGDNDSIFTKSLNYNLGLLAGLGSVINDVINVDAIKKVVNKKFDLQKLVNENTPVIKDKAEALSMITKVAFDKKALLKGNFSSIAGTYVNSEGKEIIVNKQGYMSNNNGCKGSKAKLYKLGYYTWGIGCSGGSGGAGFFFPVGIPVTLELDGGKTKIISSDTTKNRISFGHQVSGDPKNYYVRK
jgi:hypothetical protein